MKNRTYPIPHPDLKTGSACIIRNDDGTDSVSEVLSDPWKLGHGQWVVKVKGKSGGFDAARVRPIKSEVQS